MLELQGLTKRFGDVVALDGCTLTVRRGQMLGFLGPNGAGKTTTMRSIFGLVQTDEGTVAWDGQPIKQATRLGFGYMPEERGLYPRMTALGQITYFGRLHGMSKKDAESGAGQLLDEFGLTERAEARIDELSHGNQQRVQLAVAMVHQPDLLVLDEPFAGLDPVAAGVLAAALERRAAEGAAVLFSSHQLDVVEDLCEDIVIVHRGKVVAEGSVQDLRAASPRRYVDVALRSGATDWVDGLGGVEVVSRKAGRVRLLVAGEVDLPGLVAAALEAGEVVEFAMRPPDLSEVFVEVAGS
ncbi:MAG: ATP-binding cassette domain-containing protein [Acidimicrobiia bacterium]|nr:ATP-binding cassette domain-containing protein [Acidimicrobiia bacterium]